jgi:hypothetical protein
MKTRLLKAVSLLGLVLAVTPIVNAHHSFCVNYDIQKQFSSSGKVARIVWASPHTYVYVDVTDNKGNVQQWILQASAPNVALARGGWTADTLKAGDEISFRSALARDGSRKAGFMEVVFKGKTLFRDNDPVC